MGHKIMGKVGLTLSREVSLKVDWQSFTNNMVKAVTDGFQAYCGDSGKSAGSVVSLWGAAKAISVDTPVETRAMELFLLCFAWSFDQVRASGLIQEEEARQTVKDTLGSFKARAEAGDLTIPYDFFENPSVAEPYQYLRDLFIEKREAYRPNGDDRDLLTVRFDIAFRAGVWDLFSKRFSIFQDLAERLDSPAAKAADFDRQWVAYRESLINEFNVKPVFGQEETGVSLGQLYVPLRCMWVETLEREGPSRYLFGQSNGEEIHQIAMLHEELDAWVNNKDEKDWLRLIGGGPGSGKSTSVRAFAAHLAKNEIIRPLFIPLQHLNVSGGIRKSINRYFLERTGCPFEEGPLDPKHVENGPRLLLIFDGLDEISRPGIGGDEIVRDMINLVSDLVWELIGETNVRHRVLITGRMPSFQAARKRVNRASNVALEVLDLQPYEKLPIGEVEVLDDGTTIFQSRLGKTREIIGGPSKLDLRNRWWDNYRMALGRRKAKPPALTNERLADLTAEPLLCYLLALSGYLETRTKDAATNRNHIYEKLLTDVYQRHWGGGRAGTGRDLSRDDFDRLFETMALAAWHGGDERVATIERFIMCTKITRTEKIYKDFLTRGGGDVTNLAVNFYLKNRENETRGFEFTHKSFGEYLTARALIRIGIETTEYSSKRMKHALEDWLEAVNEGKLTHELLVFIRAEVRLIPVKKAVETLRSLEEMMSEVITNGLPAHELKCVSWRQAEGLQRKAETMLMTLINAFSLSIAVADKEQALIHLNWSTDRLAFKNLLNRILTSNFVGPEKKLFSRITAPDSDLSSIDLSEVDLHEANLEDSLFSYSTMFKANMSGANLKGAHFTGANLSSSDFEKANLTNAIIPNATLFETKFSAANLSRVGFQGTKFRNVDFDNANLGMANISNSYILGSMSFLNANLTLANFARLDFRAGKVSFVDANLEGAILAGIDWEKADFTRANLKDTCLENVEIKRG